MPRLCTVCANKDREKIDGDLVSGGSIRGISRSFRVSEDALSRRKAHVGAAIVRASERREERHGDNVLAQIGRVQERLWAVLGKMGPTCMGSIDYCLKMDGLLVQNWCGTTAVRAIRCRRSFIVLLSARLFVACCPLRMLLRDQGLNPFSEECMRARGR